MLSLVQGVSEKVGIPYYTACRRSWCLVSAIFEESAVHFLNSSMCGSLKHWFGKSVSVSHGYLVLLRILRILVLLLVPEVRQMPCCLELLLSCVTNALLSSFIWLAYFLLPFNTLWKAFYPLQSFGP